MEKFIILGSPRCGSNYLASLLNSHPDINCYHELFVSKERNPHFNTIKAEEDLKLKELRNNDPIKFLETHVFNNVNNAIGFKLFYHQAKDDWGIVWNYLRNNNIKVIHLKRKDKLAQFCSLKRAALTDKWTLINEENEEWQIKLSKREFKHFLDEQKQYDTQFKEFFETQTIIYYEDLCNNKEEIIKQILEFLNQSNEELNSPYIKQNKRPLKKVIKNYEKMIKLL